MLSWLPVRWGIAAWCIPWRERTWRENHEGIPAWQGRGVRSRARHDPDGMLNVAVSPLLSLFLHALLE